MKGSMKIWREHDEQDRCRRRDYARDHNRNRNGRWCEFTGSWNPEPYLVVVGAPARKIKSRPDGEPGSNS
jgi:hypothetical protein